MAQSRAANLALHLTRATSRCEERGTDRNTAVVDSEELQGTWRLVSYTQQTADGAKTISPYGQSPRGGAGQAMERAPLRIAILVLAALAFPSHSFADAKAGEKKAQLCLLCHKVANTSAPLSAIPWLEGQPARYLYLQTKAFKEKRRGGYAMQTNVANLSDRDMRDIADYLSRLTPVRSTYQLDPAKVAMGKATAAELRCSTCHSPHLSATGEIPRLAGQTPGYLKVQLEAFGSGKRQHGIGPASAPAMALSEQGLEAVAQFLASLE